MHKNPETVPELCVLHCVSIWRHNLCFSIIVYGFMKRGMYGRISYMHITEPRTYTWIVDIWEIMTFQDEQKTAWSIEYLVYINQSNTL